MATGINPQTHQFSTPYLTLAEFQDAPTGIDIDNLVVGGDQAAQNAELANVIARASSWIDTFCNQVLGATTETEQTRTRIKNDGSIIVHPRYSPIIALTAFNYGLVIGQMNAISDPSTAWIEDTQIIIPYTNLMNTYTSEGPLQFGFPGSPGSTVYVNYTYVNGYANALINTANAGQSSLTVQDATGIVAGQVLKIYDGMDSELVTVAHTYTFGSTTVPLTSTLNYSHSSGISISALPPAVKQAAILATTAFLKVRGDNALAMTVGSRPGEASAGSQHIGEDLMLAQDLLLPYRRIR